MAIHIGHDKAFGHYDTQYQRREGRKVVFCIYLQGMALFNRNPVTNCNHNISQIQRPYPSQQLTLVVIGSLMCPTHRLRDECLTASFNVYSAPSENTCQVAADLE